MADSYVCSGAMINSLIRMKIKIVATTDIGKERTNNEDAFIICPDLSQQDWSHSEVPTYIPLNKYGSLLVVADGMGGANAGEVASTIAIKSIRESFSKTNIEKALKDDNINDLLNSCIKNADEAINKQISEDPDTCGMGTTIVICWVIDNTAHIAWCGDSRCYVYNAYKGLKQLSKDHSLVQELIDNGEITEKEAFTHPENNVITRGLGDVNSQPHPDIVKYSINPNDILLLCSDGLCGYNTNKEIEHVLDANSIDVMKCRDELLKLALDAGGFDNICIALASLINDQQSVPLVPTAIQKMIIKIKKLVR